ncbi:MAG: hypothetical protein J1E39_05155 [Eubacterium sp.]|nr:hypothetical protein [Eubacterium sp.]
MSSTTNDFTTSGECTIPLYCITRDWELVKRYNDSAGVEPTESSVMWGDYYMYSEQPEETAKRLIEDYNTQQYSLTSEWDTVPDIYVPFSRAIENLALSNNLTLESITLGFNEFFYSFYDNNGSGCIEFICSFDDGTRFGDIKAEPEVEFYAPESHTFDFDTMGQIVNKVNNAYVIYKYPYLYDRLDGIVLIVDGWYYEIGRNYPWELDFKDYFCDEQVISQLIDNLRDIRANETVSYR